MVGAMSFRVYAAAAIVVLSTVAACSGDDDPDQAASSTTTSSEVSTNEASDNPFCASDEALSGDLGEIDPGDGSSDALREEFAEAGAAIAQAEADAPEEIKAAVATLARGYEDFFAALEEVDFDLTQLSESALTALDSPELQAATEQIDAYQADVCGATD